MLVDTRERRPFFRLTLASTSPKRWRVLGRMGKTLCARAGVHPNMALLRNTTSAENILGSLITKQVNKLKMQIKIERWSHEIYR